MFHSSYLPFAHRLLTTPSRRALRRSRFLFSFLLFLFSFTSTNSAFAQIDTTLREYFPMHIGDYWEYREFLGESSSLRIVGDTVLSGKRYFSFRDNYGNMSFYRIDDSMRVRGYTRSVSCPEREFIQFHLQAQDSSIWNVCVLGNSYRSYNGFLRNTIEFYPNINRTLPTKKYSGAYIDPFSGDTVFTNIYYPRHDLARGIGLIRFQGEAAPEYRLVGAIINGVTYGNVSSVGLTQSERKEDGTLLNFPNPFNSITKISFSLIKRSNVTVTVFNILGESVVVLMDNKTLESGVHEVTWNAGSLPSGIYIYKVTTEKFSELSKAILLK